MDSDNVFNEIKKAIIMSIWEALQAAQMFGLDEKQIIGFDMKQSINMINCCQKFPLESNEMIELQLIIFHRHCILLDIHEQLKFVVSLRRRHLRRLESF